MNDEGFQPPRTEAVEQKLRTEIASLLPEMRGFARFLLRDRGAADDLVQDSVVRALSAIDQFQIGTNLKAWLFTIVRNAFYEGARKRKRERRLMEEHGPMPDSANPDAEARQELHDLQSRIWALSPLLREALILVGAQEMTYEEAALVCNVPVGTVKARVSRARTALATAMRHADSRDQAVHDLGDT